MDRRQTESHLDVRKTTVRVVGAVSRRLFGVEFDELLALGCGVIREMDRRDTSVAMTFDDGPSSHSTSKILDILDQHGVSATFFLIGENARRYPELAREVAARGHEVGCHSQNHLDFHWLSPRQIASELRICKETLEDIVGSPVESVRAPFGHFRWDVRPIANRLGLSRLVGWSIAPAWNETSPVRIVEYVGTKAKPGSIILLHDATSLEQSDVRGYCRAVVDALDPLLLTLRERGLSFCVVS